LSSTLLHVFFVMDAADYSQQSVLLDPSKG